jgi:hypothetical protein
MVMKLDRCLRADPVMVGLGGNGGVGMGDIVVVRLLRGMGVVVLRVLSWGMGVVVLRVLSWGIRVVVRRVLADGLTVSHTLVWQVMMVVIVMVIVIENSRLKCQVSLGS